MIYEAHGAHAKKSKIDKNASRVQGQDFITISKSLKTIGYLCKNQPAQVRTKKIHIADRQKGQYKFDLFSSAAVLYIVSTLKDRGPAVAATQHS